MDAHGVHSTSGQLLFIALQARNDFMDNIGALLGSRFDAEAWKIH
jgi:hypothetical protein